MTKPWPYCDVCDEEFNENGDCPSGCKPDRECSACELPSSWFDELKKKGIPYEGCSFCGTKPYLWCGGCDKPTDPDPSDADRGICQC